MGSWFSDWKNVTIAMLALLVIVLSAVLLAQQRPPTPPGQPAGEPAGEAVTVLDVAFDREQRRWVNIIFDRPLGEGRVGEILGRDPATLTPSLSGVWRWQGANVLRFEPTDQLAMATEYKLTLLPESLLKPGQVVTGKSEFSIRTDQFKVERVDITEEPVTDGKHQVILRGNARFNYPVNPAVLIAKLRLIDPLLGEQHPVPLELETGYQSQVISFRSKPVEKRKEERKLTLVILADLRPEGGNVPLAADWVQTVVLGAAGKLAVRGVSPQAGETESTVRVSFSSPVSPELTKPYVKVTPDTQYRLSAEGSELILTGPFRPGESYTVVVSQGLPAADETTLAKDFSASFQVPDLDPLITFQSPGMFLSASGARTVAVKSVNTKEARLTVDRVYRNNLFFLFEQSGYPYEDDEYYESTLSHAFGDRLVDKQLPLSTERNKSVLTPLALDAYVCEDTPGLYRIGLTRQDSSRGASRWLLLTDLGIVAKQGKDEFLVWVSTFANLAPVEGAIVRLLSDQNQTLATGQTDASGMWRVQGLAKTFEKQTPHMVTVERDNDFSFLLLNQSVIDTAGFEVGGADVSKEGYVAYLYGERDIYRPGETAEGVALVRDRLLQPPPAMPLLLRHRDPEGRDRGTVKVTLDQHGQAPFTHAIPAYARTGHHTLELLAGEDVIGQYRFQVEEFVPDRIKVDIGPQKAAFSPGEEVVYDVASAYLFGPPAAGLPVESRVRLVAATFVPKGYEGFSFTDSEKKFSDQEILSEQGELDAAGKRAFHVAVPPNLTVPSSLEAVITARVQEQGGRGVAAMQRVRVHPYPYYLGLRRVGEGEGYPEPRQPVTFEYVAVAPNEAEAKAGKLRADVFRDRWHTVLRRTEAGNYRYESTNEPTLLDSQTLAEGAARGQFTFTPPEFGSYRVVLTDPATGASTQVEFFASGSGYSPWAIKHPGRLELELDKKEYRPGETATVQIRAPFSGKLLVTVEREGISSIQVYDLSGNTATVSVPVLEEHRPNAYVTATLIRSAKDLEPGTAGRAFGAVALNVDQATNRLKVDIAAPAEIRPHSPLMVQVAAAAGASVTVAAVDEGILQLIAQPTPDPFAYFYRKLALAVRGFDIYSLLLPEVKVDGKSPAGGGDGEEDLAQFVRTEGMRRVEPVAFWSGIVTADADGKATVTFDVPEFQGALRVMAVAHQGKQFGSSSHTTRVRDPLVLLPTVPRFLSFQETVQIPVTVRNDTGKEGAITVGLTAEGPVTVEGDATQTVTVAHGAEQTVYFTVKSGDIPGDVRFQLSASGNEEKTVTTAAFSLRPDLPARTLEHIGSIDQLVTSLPNAGLDTFRPETLRRELRISPLPAVQFAGKLRDLLRYPYGCVEQTTSAAFPLIYLGDLAKELDPELFAKSEPAVLVQSGIRRLSAMQLSDGGFSMWPDGDTLYPWGSVYAAHFLVEARRGGHHVENFLYDRALEFLTREVKAKQEYGWEELQRTVYALYVLARAGKADLGTMDFIREHQGQNLKPESRALLGAAYAATGNPQVLPELTKGLEDAEEVKRQSGGNLNSTVRNRALLLLAFLDGAPQDPRVPKLAQRLARDAQTYQWWTTQESALTFVALGQLFRQQAQKAPYAGKVYVGDKVIGTFTNKTVTFTDIQGLEPVRVEMEAGYEANAAFFALHLRGIPLDAGFTPEQAGLEVRRAFFTRTGAPLDLSTVTQGDLVVLKTQVRSLAGAVENVVIQNLLASGVEVENPRLKSTETLPWVNDANLEPAYQDLRDDRVLFFTDLPDGEWRTTYTLLRAVTPGTFRLPPVQAEAMYDPALRATGERGMIQVRVRK